MRDRRQQPPRIVGPRRAEERRAGPTSTTSPCCSTMVRSHIMRTTFRSWLTKRKPSSSSRRNRSSRSRMTACTETSSAAVGSSRISSRGRSAMARAMPTRAFWPPESWCGKRSSSSAGRPTRSAHPPTRAASATPSHAVHPRSGCGDAVEGAEAWVQAFGRVLEDDLDVPPQRRAVEVARRDIADRYPAIEQDLAGAAVDQPADQPGDGALAGAGFTDQAQAFARPHGEGNVVHGGDVRAVAFYEVLHFQQQRHALGGSRAWRRRRAEGGTHHVRRQVGDGGARRRRGGDQPPRIGVPRRTEQRRRRATLDHPALLHDRDLAAIAAPRGRGRE